jgi:hypothetical protein
LFRFLLIATSVPVLLLGQEQPESPTPPEPVVSPAPQAPQEPVESKRLLFLIPNYRTAPTMREFAPISAKEKFKIASQDAFDWGTLVVAGMFAAQSQASRSEPSFGQGAAGYARYLGTAGADLVIGNFLTEGVLPSVLHEDPRYFRKGSGSKWSRLGYAMGQIFVTHNDQGHTTLNLSELGGNAGAVAISMAYYPSQRHAEDAANRFGLQLGIDMGNNVLKEFWPEIRRMLSHKHN